MKLLLWYMICHLANCSQSQRKIGHAEVLVDTQPRNEERGKYRLVEWVTIEKEKDSAFRS